MRLARACSGGVDRPLSRSGTCRWKHWQPRHFQLFLCETGKGEPFRGTLVAFVLRQTEGRRLAWERAVDANAGDTVVVQPAADSPDGTVVESVPPSK